MSKISFVYFDVGGVGVIDFTANNGRQEMLQYIGVPRERATEFNTLFDELEVQSSRGINIDSFKQELVRKFNLILPKKFSFRTYLADHLVANPSIWPVIEEVKARCKIGLLTDMYPGLLDNINERGLLPSIVWDVIIDSSVEKFQKPDQELYVLAQAHTNMPAHKILFVDNLQQNLDPAVEMGWQTFLYDPKNPKQSSQDLLKFIDKNL